MRVSSQWVDNQFCSQCGAGVWIYAGDLYAKDGLPHYTCGNCEREVRFKESFAHEIPPFVRLQLMERSAPQRLPGEE